MKIKSFTLFLSIVFLFFATLGCATVSDEISLKKMTPRQRVYIGKLTVNLNGKENSKCEIYVNYDVAPSLKLSSDGLIFYKTDRENVVFKSIACLHEATPRLAAWHHKKLPLTTIVRPQESTEIAYFGDIKVTWKIDPAASENAAQKDYESKGPTRVGQVKDSGELKIEIVDNLIEIEKVFLEKNPESKDAGLHVKSHLVTLKKD